MTENEQILKVLNGIHEALVSIDARLFAQEERARNAERAKTGRVPSESGYPRYRGPQDPRDRFRGGMA